MVNKIIRQLACICVFIFGMTCVGCSPEKLVVSNVQESDDTDKKSDVNSDDTESSATTGKDTDIGEDADSSESILDEAYSEREDSELAVYVCGAVKKSGVYELPSGARINDALESAGGFADDADTDAVNLADRLQDGQRIYFPYEGETAEYYGDQTSSDPDVADIGSGLVNINTADVSGLMKLPGIGQTRAQSIVDYRQTYGRFDSKEDLKNVSGIGDSIYDGLAEYITVE